MKWIKIILLVASANILLSVLAPTEALEQDEDNAWKEAGTIAAFEDVIFYSNTDGIVRYDTNTGEEKLWITNEKRESPTESVAEEFIRESDSLIYVWNGAKESEIRKKNLKDGSETVLLRRRNSEIGSQIYIQREAYPETTAIKLLAASEGQLLYLAGQWDAMSAYIAHIENDEELLLMEDAGELCGIEYSGSDTVFILGGASTDVHPVSLQVISEKGDVLLSAKSYLPCVLLEGGLFYREDEEYDYDTDRWKDESVRVCRFDLEKRETEELEISGGYFTSHLENGLFWTMEDGITKVISLEHIGKEEIALPGQGTFYTFGNREFVWCAGSWYILDFSQEELVPVEDFIEEGWLKDYIVINDNLFYRDNIASPLLSVELPGND